MSSLLQKVFMAVLVAVTLVGCEDTPFMTKELATKAVEEIRDTRDPFHAVRNVVAIIDNDVYYFDRLDTVPRRLTHTRGEVKTDVKLSYDHTQIAYLTDIGQPVIIQASDGKLIKILPETYVRDMDWLKDRNGLYMLVEGQVTLYGASVKVIQPQLQGPYGWNEVYYFSMNSIGDQAYCQEMPGDFYSTIYYNSTGKSLDKEFSAIDLNRYDYIDFYDNTGSFLLGQQSYDDFGMEYVICITGYNFWAAYEWDYEDMNTPTFNNDVEVLLYGTVEEKPYKIKGVYLGTKAYNNTGSYDRMIKTRDDYSSNTPIYLDWVP